MSEEKKESLVVGVIKAAALPVIILVFLALLAFEGYHVRQQKTEIAAARAECAKSDKTVQECKDLIPD